MKDFIKFRRFPVVIILLTSLLLVFSGCAESFSYEQCKPDYEYGFLNGLWHGAISPITFIVSLFKDNVEMYACNNNGNWYNFGFILGAMIILGGSGSNAKRSKK